MAELAHLSAQDLAEVREWLERLSRERATSPAASAPPPRMRSPRLAKPAQYRDFIKQVTELPPHAAV